MLEGLYSAAAGMAAQEQQLDAISNDLANVNTEGYKSQRVAFSDLLYNTVDQAGTETTTGSGAGAQLIGRGGAEGAIRESGNPLDLAIEGKGYFQVSLPGGGQALTRDGAFAIDGAGQLTNAQGYRLFPPITVPAGVSASALHIGEDGTVSAGTKKIGQIKLVDVPAPDHLQSTGTSNMIATSASGAPVAVTGSRIKQGALEESNVDLAKDMALMVTTQRDYQLSSTAIQTGDQMMSIANQLRPPA